MGYEVTLSLSLSLLPENAPNAAVTGAEAVGVWAGAMRFSACVRRIRVMLGVRPWALTDIKYSELGGEREGESEEQLMGSHSGSGTQRRCARKPKESRAARGSRAWECARVGG